MASVATFVSSGRVRCTSPALPRPVLGSLTLTLAPYDPGLAADPADPLSPPTAFSLAAAVAAAAPPAAAAAAAAAAASPPAAANDDDDPDADPDADAEADLPEPNSVAFTWFDSSALPTATAVSPAYGSVLRRLTVTVRG